MGYYAKNPYEEREPPRCPHCDEFLVEARVLRHTFWECRNPKCDECVVRYRQEAVERWCAENPNWREQYEKPLE